MATFKDKLYFNFDGKNSSDFNLVHINLDNGMFEEQLVSSREIVETKTLGNDKPNFNSIESSPKEFELHLAFEGTYTDKMIDDVVRWLFVDYYKPFYFIGSGKIVYCMPHGDSRIVHNGLNQGYISLTMRCNSSKLYSPITLSEKYTILNGETRVIKLPNKGHSVTYPEISISKIGDGGVKIVNRTDNGNWCEILQLTDLEKIYINCEKELIHTDAIGVYRYDNFFGEFIRLLYGENTLEITGDCEIQFRFQDEYKF